MKFRKRPVVIDAWRVSDLLHVLNNASQGTPDLVWEAVRNGVIWPQVDRMEIHTLEGTMIATKYDWLIRGVKGEFYACKPDIFELTYEPAE